MGASMSGWGMVAKNETSEPSKTTMGEEYKDLLFLPLVFIFLRRDKPWLNAR